MIFQFELSKELLSEKVTNFLRKKILLGEYEDGFHFSETELAKSLNVSRGPVRDAIRQLETEGLVQTPSNGRTFVTGFSQTDLSDLFEIRKMLEKKAIGLIVRRRPDRDLSILQQIVHHSQSADERGLVIKLDVMFHFELMKLSGNRTLIKMWSVLRGPIHTLIDITSDNYMKLDQVPKEHEELIRLIQSGFESEACELLEKHLDTGEQVILERLKSRGITIERGDQR